MLILRPACWTALTLAVMSLAGCGVIEKTTSVPVSAVMAVIPGSRSGSVDLGLLQLEVQRYADEFMSQSNAAIDDYVRLVGTDEARSQALLWKVNMSSAAVSLASSPNPVAALIDLATVTTIMRSVLEDHWVKTDQGAAFQPWLDCSRHLETDVWSLVGRILSDAQEAELHETIRRWQEANPGFRLAFFARPQDYALVLRESSHQKKETTGLITMLGLDPVSGLDPAVREVAQARLLGDRALFMIQRMPFLARAQVELLLDQVTRAPKVEGALNDASRLSESADRISRAAESVSQTASQLPDRLSTERKAILDALETQEGKLRDLSKTLEGTLTAGDKMSTSLNTTITTFEGLMKRFGVGEPETEPEAAPDPDSKPFNILDFATTAERVTAMAKELDVLIKDAGSTLDSPALEKRFQELGAVAARATGDARSLVNYACILGAGLILLTFACALAYRWLSPRAAKVRSAESALAKTGA
jgi:hypothetical protein